MRKIIAVVSGIGLLFSCGNEGKLEQEIENIDIIITIERFDKLFGKATSENLSELKQDYPFMFSKQYSDSLWIARTKDTIQKQLNVEVEKAFPNESSFENEILSLFQHLKYYYKILGTRPCRRLF